MVVFSNAKINIGLYVTSKRPDGFHNIETIFYPIGLSDIIEFVPSEKYSFTNSGFLVDCQADDNLINKAYKLMQDEYDIPPLSLHLHKNTPFGAGLGGGSSNAAFIVKSLNQYFRLQIPEDRQFKIAESLGSDCPFFIYNKPAFAKSKGEEIAPVDVDLSNYTIIVVKPPISVPTRDAFAGIKTTLPKLSLTEAIRTPIEAWKDTIFNQFEETVFEKYPEIKSIKEKLYDIGAVFALMSGSGSAVYGIFNKSINLHGIFPKEYFVWKQM